MKINKLLIAFLALALILSPHAAEAKKRHHTPHHKAAGVDRDAGYADIVIDAETGRIIHETYSDELRHPASLTKMMTLYITFEALESGRLSLGEYIPVSENASYQSPSKLGLHAGQHIKVEDAILGIVTESANDAAVAMGEALGGSEEDFADMMTKQAHALGMKHTVFRNPSGLPDPEQVTTAHDMAVLGAALISHYPQYYPYFNRDSFTYAGIYHHNHNHLMDRYEGMDGIKTGYIRASGFNLVASAKHDDIRLVGVIFGGRSAVERDNAMAHLLDQSFDAADAGTGARTGHTATVTGEGDSSDNDAEDYIALPAKYAVVFPLHGASANSRTQTVSLVTPSLPPSASRAVLQQAVLKPPQMGAPANASWGIQIGAYSDPAIGQQALASLVSTMPGWLTSARSEVQKVAAGGTIMYRARLMSLDKKTAQSVCSYLIQHGKSCLTVEP